MKELNSTTTPKVITKIMVNWCMILLNCSYALHCCDHHSIPYSCYPFSIIPICVIALHVSVCECLDGRRLLLIYVGYIVSLVRLLLLIWYFSCNFFVVDSFFIVVVVPLYMSFSPAGCCYLHNSQWIK